MKDCKRLVWGKIAFSMAFIPFFSIPVQNILYSLMVSIGDKGLCNFQLILLDFQEEWVLMKKGDSFVVLLLDFVNEPRHRSAW